VNEAEQQAHPCRRLVIQKGLDKQVVLYWYQSPRRVVAGEWAAKLSLVADAVRDKRTDTALLRVIAWSTPGHDDEATSAATALARSVYPLLRQLIPTSRRNRSRER